MIKLVVTGCRGFIGSNFLEHFLDNFEANFDQFDGIILVDAGYLSGLGDIPEWNMRVNLNIYNDLKSQCESMGKSFEEFNTDINQLCDHPMRKAGVEYVVINFASESHVDNSINDPFGVFNENSTLVPNLITWLGINSIKKFVHIRTDEEYGHLVSKDDAPFKLGDPINPRNPYSASKAGQTLFLKSIKNTLGFNVKFITLANQYGKYQHHSKMIPTTVKRLVQGNPASIYGSGEQLREWTYIGDTCPQILNHLLNGEGDIHISDSSGLMTNLELVKSIMTIVDDYYGTNSHYKFIDDRKGHDFCYKLQQTEDFKYTPFELGIKETVKHYIEFYE